MTLEEAKEYIGSDLEAFLSNGELTPIKVVNVKQSKAGIVFIDENANVWLEEEINWVFRCTPEYLLYEALVTTNIIKSTSDFNPKKFELAFQTFMESMIKSEYISKTE